METCQVRTFQRFISRGGRYRTRVGRCHEKSSTVVKHHDEVRPYEDQGEQQIGSRGTLLLPIEHVNNH